MRKKRDNAHHRGGAKMFSDTMGAFENYRNVNYSGNVEGYVPTRAMT